MTVLNRMIQNNLAENLRDQVNYMKILSGRMSYKTKKGDVK
jgi:peptide subunit release factor RF-3